MAVWASPQVQSTSPVKISWLLSFPSCHNLFSLSAASWCFLFSSSCSFFSLSAASRCFFFSSGCFFFSLSAASRHFLFPWVALSFPWVQLPNFFSYLHVTFGVFLFLECCCFCLSFSSRYSIFSRLVNTLPEDFGCFVPNLLGGVSTTRKWLKESRKTYHTEKNLNMNVSYCIQRNCQQNHWKQNHCTQ